MPHPFLFNFAVGIFTEFRTLLSLLNYTEKKSVKKKGAILKDYAKPFCAGLPLTVSKLSVIYSTYTEDSTGIKKI